MNCLGKIEPGGCSFACEDVIPSVILAWTIDVFGLAGGATPHIGEYQVLVSETRTP